MKRLITLLLLSLALAPAVVRAAAPVPTVAVLYFDYDGKNDEMAMLRKGLAQMLISDLTGAGTFDVVERARLQDVLDELKLSQSTKIDRATANHVGKLLGARLIVVGGYFDFMGTLRIDARLIEVETGKVLHSSGETCKPEAFLDLEQKLAVQLTQAIVTVADALPPPTATAAAAATSPKPKPKRPPAPKSLSTAAARTYGQALDAKDRGDTTAAQQKLEEVLKTQPDFALAAADLAALAR